MIKFNFAAHGLALTLLALLLTGCGQSGKLYLPEAQVKNNVSH